MLDCELICNSVYLCSFLAISFSCILLFLNDSSMNVRDISFLRRCYFFTAFVNLFQQHVHSFIISVSHILCTDFLCNSFTHFVFAFPSSISRAVLACQFQLSRFLKIRHPYCQVSSCVRYTLLLLLSTHHETITDFSFPVMTQLPAIYILLDHSERKKAIFQTSFMTFLHRSPMVAFFVVLFQNNCDLNFEQRSHMFS